MPNHPAQRTSDRYGRSLRSRTIVIVLAFLFAQFGLSNIAATKVSAASPPAWDDFTIAVMELDVPYSDGVLATGDPAPTYSVTTGSLPPGITLNPTSGAIVGTPTSVGQYPFTITATNGEPDDITQDLVGDVRIARGCRSYTGASYVGAVVLNADGTPIGCGTTPEAGAPADLIPEGWAATFAALNTAQPYTTRLGWACDDCWVGIAGPGSTSLNGFPIGFPINFYGTEFSTVFVNSNGSISFGGGSPTYNTPLNVILDGHPGVVAYGLDIFNGDVLAPNSSWGTGRHGDFFYWGRTTYQGHSAFVATWMNILPCCDYNATPLDRRWSTFQIMLVDVDDAAGTDVDVVVNYGGLSDSGQGYSCGLSGNCVAIGLGTVDPGTGDTTYASIVDDDGILYNGMLVSDVVDSGIHPLRAAHLNSAVPGRFNFQMRDGALPQTATIPSAPIDLAATPGDGSAAFTWSPPTNLGGSPIASYRVRYRVAGSSDEWLTDSASASPYSAYQLVDGTDYEFQVAATNGIGTGPWSTLITTSGLTAPVWVDVTLPPMPIVHVGDVFSDGVLASGIPAPTYAVTAGVLPLGLSLNPTTGAITGVPTTQGAFDFTITATNGVGDDVVMQFTGSIVEALVPSDLGFVGLTPARLLDTREGTAKYVGGSEHELVVLGEHGVPSDSIAVVLSVTATEAEHSGYLTLYACGTTRPLASNVNFAFGAASSNAVTTNTGTDGKVCIYSSAATHVVVDVDGAYSPSAGVGLVGGFTPARLFDSRDAGGSKLLPGTVHELTVAGQGGVVADATAVALSVTVTEPDTAGFVTVFPCGVTAPWASNVNFVRGQTVSTPATSAVGTGGKVCVFTSAATHLVVDATADYSSTHATGHLRPTVVTRVLDTRESTGPTSGAKVGLGQVQEITIPSVTFAIGAAAFATPTTSAVTLNVAVDDPATAGFVTVYPCGVATPWASNLNFVIGQTVSSAVTTAVGAGGKVCVFTSVSTHLVVDVDALFSGIAVPV